VNAFPEFSVLKKEKMRRNPYRINRCMMKTARKYILITVVSFAFMSFEYPLASLSFAQSQPVKENQEERASVPFGFHIGRIYPKDIVAHNPNNLADPELWGTYSYAQDIGVGWERPGMYAFIPPEEAGISWQQVMDSNYGGIPISMNILATIDVRRWTAVQPSSVPEELKKLTTYNPPVSYLKLLDEKKYIQFVRDLVERYDGDGVDDMPGLKNPIKYWQIDNELPGPAPSEISPAFNPETNSESTAEWLSASLKNYTHILEITIKAIRAQDPEAKIALSGMADVGPATEKLFRAYYLGVLQRLEEKHIDIFDYHFYGNGSGDWKVMKDAYQMIREGLDKIGYKDTLIWITETAAYTGRPRDVQGDAPYKTEKEQAIDLFKRIIFPFSFGVKKIFWFSIMDNPSSEGPDGHTGLLYNGKGEGNPGYCAKKLSYYTAKKLTEMLRGCNWENMQVIQEKDGIGVYKFMKQANPLWVVWNDTQEEKQVEISGIVSNEVLITEALPRSDSGKGVQDYYSAFHSETKAVKEGKASISVKDIPVFVSEK